MYIQENLTTTSYEVPGVSWELPEAFKDAFFRYGAFAKLVLSEDRTAIADIVEDVEKKEAFERERTEEEARRRAEEAERKAQLEKQSLEAQGIKTFAKAMFRQAAAGLAAEDVILCRGLAEAWAPGAYQVGDVRTENGVPYRCCQAHDSTGNTAWDPENTPALWAAYHGTSAETALPWKAPTGAHDLYKQGEVMIWTDGKIMRALQDTNFSPEEVPAFWEDA